MKAVCSILGACRLARPRTVAGSSPSAPRSAARSPAAGPPRLFSRASSPLVSLRSASRLGLVRHPVNAPRRSSRRGLTRQCSGPGVCTGLQCFPRIRAAVVVARPLIASSLGRTQSGLGCCVLTPSGKSADRRGFSPIGSTVRGAAASAGSSWAARPVAPSAALLILRVRPNQAMQRTGGVRGFTVLPPDPGRRWGRPAADCFFVSHTCSAFQNSASALNVSQTARRLIRVGQMFPITSGTAGARN